MYAFNMIRGLLDMGYGDEIILIVNPKDAKYFSEMFPEARLLSSPFFILNNRSRFYDKLLLHINDRIFIKAQITCLWYPYVAPGISVSRTIKRICTIHDLIPLDRDSDSSNWIVYNEMLNSCQNIISISEYVKDDIEKNFPGVSVQSVIYNPVSIDAQEIQPVPEIMGKSFILDLNAYSERKNIKTLVMAFKKIVRQVDCDLVFCGGENINGYYEKMRELVSNQQLDDRVHFFYRLPISQRNWLLENATLLVSPTTSEGFGRTPIEAAICKKPVLTTKVDSLLEVTDGLLNYYDNPFDADELADAILKIYNEEYDEKKAEAISNHFVEKYNPKRIVEQYYVCVEKLGAFKK